MTAGEAVFAALYVSAELSDDDVELSEVASQCGYDVVHPQVVDLAEPVVSQWHGQSCLLLKLSLLRPLSAVDLDALLPTLELSLSHPSLSAFSPCAITPWAS